ncbi:MAG: adenylate/guanylate cyclase domain-containing protein [Gammaproteobacteria bacterium]|nr:adenylate/guanylate cyclase domain-containing protein [Gammaproteobacteria bacterium]NNJ49695.1 adenylate/guanylate cyclase domain-containing protein [Gammaproteobacteria bacterium]
MDIQRIIRYALSLVLTLLFLLHVGEVINIPILTSLENQAYDARLKITLPENVDKQVVIVDIDEKSLDEIGQWPWNRNILATINDVLFDHYQIKAIGYDIVFAEEDIDEGTKLLNSMATGSLQNDPVFIEEYQRVIPSLQHDQRFAEALKDRKTVMGFVMDTDSIKGELPRAIAELDNNTLKKLAIHKAEGYTANLRALQSSAFSGGFFNNPLLDYDGVFRRVPLLQTHENELHESLALALTRAATGSPAIEMVVETSEESDDLFLEWITIGEIAIPVDHSSGVLVPYIGKRKSFEYISATDVLNKRVDKNILEGKITLFGTSAPGLLDLRTTPLEPAYPGVEVHANIIQGILDGRILHAPGYTKGFEFILISFIGIVLTFTLPMLSALYSTLVILGSIVLLITTNFYAWTNAQLVLPIAAPVLLVVVLFALQMTYGFFVESRGKRQLAHLFGQYVPPELVEEMSLKMEDINLDGEMREMSVLFSDVRGFTTISESLEPKELTDYINAFLTPITKVIHDHRGTIDKYMGDAVMAFWGAPLEDDLHALHALNAATGIVERMKSLRKEFSEKNWPEIYVGVGVNTGNMNVGNKGSEFRVDYTVLGDAVNLGSRLEGLTKVYGVDIITSEFTRHAVPEYEYRELDRVRVKGKDKPVSIYEPLGLLEDISKDERKLLKQFHIGIKQFRAQNWDAAEREIFALSQLEPDRKIYKIYLDRIMFYREHPPAEDWDGSFTHTSK